MKLITQLALLLGVSISAQAEIGSDVLVEEYLNARMGGDLAGLEQRTGGPLLSELRSTLGNPTYAQHLIDTYSGASFEVLGQHSLGRRDGVRVRVYRSDVGFIDSVFVVGRDPNLNKVVVSEIETQDFCQQRQHPLCAIAVDE